MTLEHAEAKLIYFLDAKRCSYAGVLQTKDAEMPGAIAVPSRDQPTAMKTFVLIPQERVTIPAYPVNRAEAALKKAGLPWPVRTSQEDLEDRQVDAPILYVARAT